jgi:large subunit ribosomal protein L10
VCRSNINLFICNGAKLQESVVALNLDAKKAIVAQVAEIANSSVAALAADYRGLTVAQVTALRRAGRKVDVHVQVVRNTLARRALEGSEFECMRDQLTGPMILAFSKNEPAAAARLFRDFVKEIEQLEVKALSVGGTLYGSKDLEKVASLPTKDEAIAQLLSCMQAPISKLVRTMAEPQAKLVRLFAAIREQKEQSA